MRNGKIRKYHIHEGHPEKLQFEIYPLHAYLVRNGELARKPHVHSFYQIIWFMSGSGKEFEQEYAESTISIYTESFAP